MMKVIKETVSHDGKRRLRIRQGPPSNLFRFSADERMEDTHPIDGPIIYWYPIPFSGLYDSAEAAEGAARTEIPWLRDEDSN